MNTDVSHVLVTCAVKRGNLGKSTALSLLAGWLEQRGIPWQGFDLDPDHQSFVRLFPDTVQSVPLGEEPEGDIIRVLRAVTAKPVTLIDPRAHLSGTILRAWEMIRFPGTFAASGGRITALVCPADDLEVMADLDATVTRLGSQVNYLVVRNPARSPRTHMFDGSELEAELTRLRAAFVKIPPLLSLARNHLAAKEAELGRGITPAEAVANRELGLDPMVRVLIEDWLRTVFQGFDSVASQLLPTAFAEKIKPADLHASAATVIRRGAKLNLKQL
jgi:hypothetical protein